MTGVQQEPQTVVAGAEPLHAEMMRKFHDGAAAAGSCDPACRQKRKRAAHGARAPRLPPRRRRYEAFGQLIARQALYVFGGRPAAQFAWQRCTASFLRTMPHGMAPTSKLRHQLYI